MGWGRADTNRAEIVHKPTGTAWDKFAEKVKAEGLKPRDCGNGHWRIEGGLTEVNYYPFSKNKTIYVNLTTGNASIPGGTVEHAIRAARDPGALPMVGRNKVKRRAPEKMRKLRLLMLAFKPFCEWCGLLLTPETSTLDHVIPLARGGTNQEKNLVLACKPCNQGRGHC